MAEVKITWKDAEYVIPDTRAFQIGERIEEIAPLGEILGWLHQPRFFKMARCLGEMLRFAGCKVSDQEVHAQLVGSMGKADDGDNFAGAVFALVDLLMGDAPKGGEGKIDPEGKPDAS
ncbi:hypothetical protein [Neotabrizicola sp. sgz301269]|uniref:hypothetical protein n=1 Tax=Neotabrizicola sp. sgz301269 TaxID=3276282 RepID=UPI00376FD09C